MVNVYRERDWHADALRLPWEEFVPRHGEVSKAAYSSFRNRNGYRAGHYAESPSVLTPDKASGGTGDQVIINGVTAGEAADVDGIFERHAKQYAASARTNERKRRQTVHLPHEAAMIVLTSDSHIGGIGTDIERLYEEQEQILSTPNTYVILGGDIVDNYVIGKLTSQNMFHQITIPEEWLLATDYMQRWDGRVIAACAGNHDVWTEKLVGLDMARSIVPKNALYDRDEVSLTVYVNDNPVKFRIRHKWRGNSEINATHAMEKSVRFDDPEPDILVGGHVHKGAMCREFHHAGKRKVAILTGTFKVIDAYQKQEGFVHHDSSTSAAVIIMPDGSFHATSNLNAACQFMHAISG